MTSAPTWPHPSELVSISLAARLIGCHRTSLSRQIQKVRDGNPQPTKDARIDVVARIFFSNGRGTNPAVESALLIDALKIPAHQVSQTLPKKTDKEIRHRISKKARTRLRTTSEDQLGTMLSESIQTVQRRYNLNARRWLKDIIDAYTLRGIKFPLDRVDGFPPGLFKPFVSVSDWTAFAGPDDRYFFFFRDGKGRPLDYLMLTVKDVDNATFRFLTLTEWLDAIKNAVSLEVADAETRLFDTNLRKPGRGLSTDGPLPII